MKSLDLREKHFNMAWVNVPGSFHAGANTHIWEYDNAATETDTYVDANGSTAAGVRTFTPPGGNTQYTYIKCRKKGETIERGELSKNYYDNKFANGIP